MSFIDWSDPEVLFGLLIEYVADEWSAAREPGRRDFLAGLRESLEGAQARPPGETLEALCAIRDSIDREFEADAVVAHLGDCIEELERIRRS